MGVETGGLGVGKIFKVDAEEPYYRVAMLFPETSYVTANLNINHVPDILGQCVPQNTVEKEKLPSFPKAFWSGALDRR